MTSVRLVSEEGNTSDALVVFATTARTDDAGPTYNSGSLDMSEYKEAVVFLDITAVLGTNPTLDVTVQRQDSRSSNWVSWDDGTDQAFSQKSATGTFALPLNAPLGDTIRLQAVVGGDNAVNVTVDFNDVDPDTIARSTGSFITDGILVGDIVVTNAAQGGNNTTFTVDTVAALTLTLDIGDAVVGDTADAITITNITNSFTFAIEMERKVI